MERMIECQSDGQDTTVTYDLATLTFREVLLAHLRGRFPHARHPIFRWVSAVVILTLCLAVLGFSAGMAAWPRFRPETMAIAFAMPGAISPLLMLIRVQRVAGTLRREGQCTTQLCPDGILRRTLTRECKYRWIPGQRFLLREEEVLIFLRANELLWLPRLRVPIIRKRRPVSPDRTQPSRHCNSSWPGTIDTTSANMRRR